MGIVYQARDAGGRRVALKVMPGGNHQPLLEEARLLGLVAHPHVVEVLDYGVDEGAAYIAMRHIDGPSLRKLRRWGRDAGLPLPSAVGLRILIDALAGLHAAHEASADGQRVDLVHRDFTPENILIRQDGSPVLVDFGVARARSRPSDTAHGMLKGKIHYMSPEQVRGDGLDRRSDVFSAGVVAWELITGRRPFRRTSDLQTLLAIGRGARPRLCEVAPHVPAAIATAVEQALAPEPDHRFDTARAFARALTRAAIHSEWLAPRARVERYLREVTPRGDRTTVPAPARRADIASAPAFASLPPRASLAPPLDRQHWTVVILALVAVAIVGVSLVV